MKLYRIIFSPADIDSMPEKYRKLLLFLCAGISELNVLSKVFRFSPSSSPEGHLEEVASLAQGMLLGQIYTGKVFEFWKSFQVLYFASSVSSEYISVISSASQDSLKELKSYFGRTNLIEKVRNNHAFHHSPEKVEAVRLRFPQDERFSLYVSDSLANSVFEFADLLYIHATMETINPGDPEGVYKSLIEETASVTAHLNRVVSELIATLLKEHLPESLSDLASKQLEINAIKESDVQSLPFFIELDEH